MTIGDTEIQQTIALIDRRISKLQRIKTLLLEEFGASKEVQIPLPSALDDPAFSVRSRPIRRKARKRRSGKTRKNMVKEFLQAQGPSKRKDIVESLKIPVGTVAFVLHDKETFVRDDDGRWDARKI